SSLPACHGFCSIHRTQPLAAPRRRFRQVQQCRQSAWGGSIFGSHLAAIAYNEDFATLSGRTRQNIMAQNLAREDRPWFHPVCSPASAVITPANKAVSPACFAAPQTVATGNMR